MAAPTVVATVGRAGAGCWVCGNGPSGLALTVRHRHCVSGGVSRHPVIVFNPTARHLKSEVPLVTLTAVSLTFTVVAVAS